MVKSIFRACFIINKWINSYSIYNNYAFIVLDRNCFSHNLTVEICAFWGFKHYLNVVKLLYSDDILRKI